MAYKVKFKGVIIECETARDAISIARELAGEEGQNAPDAPESTDSEGGRVTTSRYREFIGYLDANQKKFLAQLVDNPHGKTDHSLRQVFGLTGNQQLGGFISGISKLAKKTGLSMDEVMKVEWVKIGDENAKEYRPQPAFRKIALEIGGLK
jgi:hypothetical protein